MDVRRLRHQSGADELLLASAQQKSVGHRAHARVHLSGGGGLDYRFDDRDMVVICLFLLVCLPPVCFVSLKHFFDCVWSNPKLALQSVSR